MSVNPTTGTNYHDLGTPSQDEMKRTLFNLGEQLTKAHEALCSEAANKASLPYSPQADAPLETIRSVAQTLSDLNSD